MSAHNENPLTIPASLAANGMQGEGASDGQTAGGFHHTAESADSLLRLGVSFAFSGCDALSLATDAPAPGIVEACDCIEAAARFLGLSAQLPNASQARVSDTPEGAP